MILEKIYQIQQKLQAPKSEWNDYSKFKYRSAEKILELLKPILKEENCVLTLKDDLVLIGERYYIKATAILYDVESGESLIATSFARESEVKKGMDESQITGAASSYARKYAMNGLFAIDDRKDNDSNEVVELGDADELEMKSFRDTCESMGLDYQKVWKVTGKVSDISKKHLANAQRWLVDYGNVTKG